MLPRDAGKGWWARPAAVAFAAVLLVSLLVSGTLYMSQQQLSRPGTSSSSSGSGSGSGSRSSSMQVPAVHVLQHAAHSEAAVTVLAAGVPLAHATSIPAAANKAATQGAADVQQDAATPALSLSAAPTAAPAAAPAAAAPSMNQPLPSAPGSSGGLTASPPPQGGVFDCRASGYCSRGRVRVFRGDVATNKQLRRMLQAVAYRKEVIFTLLGGGGLEAQLAVNLAKSAEDLGLAHFFILARNASVCSGLPPVYHNISCVWDSRPEAGAGPEYQVYGFWGRRWETVARILRMGYNVLSLDTDTMLLHDPYMFLKSKQLGKYNALFQQDNPHLDGGVNCGVMYWQNAHPSGPAAWMAVEHADRTIRQREGAADMRRVYPKWTLYHTRDQPMWQDMVSSVAAGRPTNIVLKDIAPKGWDAIMQPDERYKGLKHIEVDWPADWHLVIGQERGQLAVIDRLTVPRPPNASWWQQHGRFFYPPRRRKKSQAFIKLIRSASQQPCAELDLPWQPPKPPLPVEHMAFLPHWFVVMYAIRGVKGYFALKPPAQVVSHIVFLPPAGKAWKSYIFRGHNWWHWEVTEAFTGNNVLGLPQPRLLMLAPGVQLYTETEEGFRDEVEKLARLALMMGRQLVMPNPPCDSSWVGLWPNTEEQGTTSLQLYSDTYDGGQVLQFPDPWNPGHTYCHWIRGITKSCLPLFPAHADVLAFLQRAHISPSKANTLYHRQWLAARKDANSSAGSGSSGGGSSGRGGGSSSGSDGGSDGSSGGSSGGSKVAGLPPQLAESVVKAAAGFAVTDVPPVLFLGALPDISDAHLMDFLPAAYSACWLLSPLAYFEYSEPMREKRLEGLSATQGNGQKQGLGQAEA